MITSDNDTKPEEETPHENEPTSKRARHNDEPQQRQQQITVYQEEDERIRTSSLAEPTMRLTGHKGSIYALAFDPLGESLCSGSFDMTCLLWSATGNCENYNLLSGHKNAILDLAWSLDSDHIVTASADTNLGWYDAMTGKRIKRFMDHEGIVNAVDTVTSGTAPLVASGSDDTTARIWDARVRKHVQLFQHDYQVTAIAFDSQLIYTGGIDNNITAWDLRNQQKTMTMKGHTDTLTCLTLHPKATHLLSNSMDGTLRSWDIRPFVSGKRHCKTFVGGTHNAEKGLLNCAWSSDGSMVTGGSADRAVHIWDEYSAEELYYLPGHSGCINSVVFHPKENVIASGSSDKSIFVGELAQ